MKKLKIAAVITAAAMLCGCSAGNFENSDSSDGSLDMTGDISSVQFETGSDSPVPDTPYLEYLGCLDINSLEGTKMYLADYAANAEDDVITREYVSPHNLALRLSERISADLSPDICDKADESFPYLMLRNTYEDLTPYIDISAPQWDNYSDYIAEFSQNGAHYFYPTKVTVSPQVLIYDKTRLANLGLSDPAKLYKEGGWNRSALENMLLYAKGVGGGAVIENFLAAAGVPVVSEGDLNFSANIDSEVFADTALFVNRNFVRADISALTDGSCAFYSADVKTLAEIREKYPESGLAFVPYPVSEDETSYYTAVSEGFLVPRRAKNIKGAASFINCARIAEKNAETDYSELLPEDIEMLNLISENAAEKTIFIGSLCLDTSANIQTERLFNEIYTDKNLEENWKSLSGEISPILTRSVAALNESLK